MFWFSSKANKGIGVLRGVWLVQKFGSWVQGWLPLSPLLLPFFSPCLQRGLLNPPMWAVMTPFPLNCPHLWLPTPSYIPRKQKHISRQPLPWCWEGPGQQRVGCTPCPFHPESQAPMPLPKFSLQCSRSFKTGGWGSGAAYNQLASNSHFLLPWNVWWMSDNMDWVHVIEGLQKVQGTVWLWVVRLRLKKLEDCKHGDSQTQEILKSKTW